MALIELRNVSKQYTVDGQQVEALKNVNLSIDELEIFGIIGMSGAGKSTLVRCINYLEKPTMGVVWVEGQNLATLSDLALRKQRSNMGMIFQHFNLLMQKNVLDNIRFPLSVLGWSKKKAKERARELLEIVGLSDKEKAYPAQLSGGQKQRVAIARALASNPKILLCDEATSALDPQTTESILALLKEINEKMKVTIVLITHQMSVVQQICTKVAIMDHGEVVETGEMARIFAAPKSQAAKELIIYGDKPVPREIPVLEGERKIRIVFSENSAFEPVIGNMVLKFGMPVNILKADTQNVGGFAQGEMILGLPQGESIQSNMIAYLREKRLTVEEVK